MRSLSLVLHCDKTRRAFKNTFLSCYQMPVVPLCNTRLRLLHLLCDIEVMWQKNNETRFVYVLYSDKTWVFDQSERA